MVVNNSIKLEKGAWTLREMGMTYAAAMQKMIRVLLIAACLLPAIGWQPAYSAGSPMVSGEVIRNFARITFYWMEKVGFNTQLEGKRLFVRFDRPVNPDFGEILRSLYPYVTKAELSGDQRTIVFTLQKPYHIRTFITETESGIDLVGINDDFATESEPEPPAAQAPAPKAAGPVITPPPPAEKPAVPAKPQPAIPQPDAVPAPEARVTEKPAITAAEPLPSSPAPPPVEMALGTQLAVELQTVDTLPTLTFPWKERVAAAVWARGNSVWILFNKPIQLTQLPELADASQNWLRRAEQIAGAEDHTLLRLITQKPLSPIARKDKQGYSWNVSLTATPTPPTETIPPQLNTDVSEPFIFFTVSQMEGPYRVQDPQVGDVLSVIPLFASDTGISPSRSFVDVQVLETAQGIVLAPLADQVAVTRMRNGIRISAPDGLFLSPGLAAPTPPQAEAEISEEDRIAAARFKPTLFPARNWIAGDGSGQDFRDMKSYLLYEISTASSLLKRNQWRKKLAELYLGESLISEALGVLARIEQSDPAFYQNQKLKAYEGAAQLLDFRLTEAAASFAAPELDAEPEAELWRKAVAASMDAAADPVPYMAFNDAYIRQYPTELRQRLAIIAANHAIRQNDFIMPLKIFASLEADEKTDEIKDYIAFLRAKIAAEVGREDDAERIWKELAEKTGDRQFRARAEYALTLLQLGEEKITPEEAAQRLDDLRIVWRGDDLEQSLLIVLGQLYVNLGDYWEGMKAWEELLQYYPNTPEAIAAYQRLSETFHYLFLEAEPDEMTPLEALALYNEFQELTPLGAEGDRMVRKLVDRLVEVDLLEEAAARLENQVEYRLKGREKSVVGARLAFIYLMNRQPQEALEALQKTRVDGVSAELSLERNRLSAKALLDYGRPEQALGMIEGDYSPEGEAVRLEAYWQMEDWANVIDIIELMFRNRPAPGTPAGDVEGQRLLQLALAYIFLGEYDQLAYLREAYIPLLEGHPLQDEFIFLTQERVPVNHASFQDVIGTIAGMQSFMGSFRAELEEKGLSGTIAEATTGENTGENTVENAETTGEAAP